MLWAGVFAFAIQIYADFSAYSDIARGIARWLGFDLMRNFDHPVHGARARSEFWRRWHISLSTWFRDYVYIPLGGSRGGPLDIAQPLRRLSSCPASGMARAGTTCSGAPITARSSSSRALLGGRDRQAP